MATSTNVYTHNANKNFFWSTRLGVLSIISIALVAAVTITTIIHSIFRFLNWRRDEFRAGRCGHLWWYVWGHQYRRQWRRKRNGAIRVYCRTCRRKALREWVEGRVERNVELRVVGGGGEEEELEMHGGLRDEVGRSREERGGMGLNAADWGVRVALSRETLPRYEEHVHEVPPEYEEIEPPRRPGMVLVREERWREIAVRI